MEGCPDLKELFEMNDGAFMERAEYEMSRISENLGNVNTSYKAKRTLTLRFTFTTDEMRNCVFCGFSAESKLAPLLRVMYDAPSGQSEHDSIRSVLNGG